MESHSLIEYSIVPGRFFTSGSLVETEDAMPKSSAGAIVPLMAFVLLYDNCDNYSFTTTL